MWSAKTTTLMMQLLTYKNGAEIETALFTPDRDSRSGVGLARSHDGLELMSISCAHPREILDKISPTCKVVGIEEAHLWMDTQTYTEDQIIETWNAVLDELEETCDYIFIAGLDKSYYGKFFASHLAFSARCLTQSNHSWCRTEDCRNPAMFTSLIRKLEATGDIIVGGRDLYQPACRKHFYINLIAQESATPL